MDLLHLLNLPPQQRSDEHSTLADLSCQRLPVIGTLIRLERQPEGCVRARVTRPPHRRLACMRLACYGSILARIQHSVNPVRPRDWRPSQLRHSWPRSPATMAAAVSGSSRGGEYRTLARSHSIQLVVKGSKFLAIAWPVSDRAEVLITRSRTARLESVGLSRNLAKGTAASGGAMKCACSREAAQPKLGFQPDGADRPRSPALTAASCLARNTAATFYAVVLFKLSVHIAAANLLRWCPQQTPAKAKAASSFQSLHL